MAMLVFQVQTKTRIDKLIALIEVGVPKKNIFVDKMSGKNFERPQYKKLLKKLNPGNCCMC